LSFVNPNTWHLICNNFNLNFIFDIVCLFVRVCAFSLRRESPDMILGDKPLIFEVVLSQGGDTDMWAPRSQCRVLNQLSQSIQTCSNSLYTQASTMINSTTEVYIWIVKPTAENI
jgi:hypothetical protein